MSKWHFINADLLPVKPQTLPLNTRGFATQLLQRLRYAPMKTESRGKGKQGFTMFHFPPARVS